GAVLGDDGPAVLELRGGRVADGDHRLDREDQAGHEPGAATGAAVVEHVRVLVHLRADPVPAVVVDDAVRVRFGGDDLLDGVADVGQPAAGHGAGQPRPHGAVGDVEQRGVLGRRLADGDRDGGVAVPARQDRPAVDGDVVALGQPA